MRFISQISRSDIDRVLGPHIPRLPFLGIALDYTKPTGIPSAFRNSNGLQAAILIPLASLHHGIIFLRFKGFNLGVRLAHRLQMRSYDENKLTISTHPKQLSEKLIGKGGLDFVVAGGNPSACVSIPFFHPWLHVSS